MSRVRRKLVALLGVMGAVAITASAAEAQSSRTKPVKRTVTNSYVQQPSFRGSYNYAPPRGGGVNFGDGRMGANYNPNQG